MAAPLSLDLRQRIVDARAEGLAYEQIATQLRVGEASVSRILHRHRVDGTIEPILGGKGRPSKIKGDVEDALVKLVNSQPDLTLAELKEILFEQTGEELSTSAISRALIRLKLTRKKKPFAQKNNHVLRQSKLGRHSKNG